MLVAASACNNDAAVPVAIAAGGAAAVISTSPLWGRGCEYLDACLVRAGTREGYASAFDRGASWFPNVDTVID